MKLAGEGKCMTSTCVAFYLILIMVRHDYYMILLGYRMIHVQDIVLIHVCDRVMTPSVMSHPTVNVLGMCHQRS